VKKVEFRLPPFRSCGMILDSQCRSHYSQKIAKALALAVLLVAVPAHSNAAPSQHLLLSTGAAHEIWTLSDKIAAIASIAAFLQFLALVATIGVMILNGRRQLRAYVFMENAWATPDETRRVWTVNYQLKNTGATPARGVRINYVATSVDWPTRERLTPETSHYYGTMAPNGDFIEGEFANIPGPTWDQFQAGRAAIVFVGSITYQDAFRKNRFSDFSFFSTQYIDAENEMSVHDDGNESN
jgi:hypothetical protein